MRVVLDTNILLSGLMSATGAPGRLLDAWLEDRFVLVSSEEQLREFRRASRIYKALKHQITVNKHRANALKTFQAFVKAASNDNTRDAVLIETTRSIFANSPSGYLDTTDASSDSNTKILEIIKGSASGAK